MVAVFFVLLVYYSKAVVDLLQDLRQLLQSQEKLFLQFRVGVVALLRLVVQLHQSQGQVVEHQPEVGKVVGFVLVALEGGLEEVVKQLVAFLVASW